MTTITITTKGTKAGEQIFWILKVAKENFLAVVDMFDSWDIAMEDVIKGESTGLYTITNK